jgi:hypothetical protein
MWWKGRFAAVKWVTLAAVTLVLGVVAGHVAFALLGLLLWAGFMLTGWAALGWTATGVLAPVAGAGMGILVLGLPSPARPRVPVFVIAAHGLFAAAVLLLVITATIGAG